MRLAVPLSVALLLGIAPALSAQRTDSSSSPAPATQAGAPATAALTDASIAAILDAANNYDIETGELGAKRAASPAVRAYGKMIARDHRILLANTRRLAERHALVSPLPAKWEGKEDHQEAMRTLLATKGREFDRAFLEHEAQYHQDMIDAVTGTLLPAIHDGELHAFLAAAAPAFVAHRDAAKKLLEQMDKPDSTVTQPKRPGPAKAQPAKAQPPKSQPSKPQH